MERFFCLPVCFLLLGGFILLVVGSSRGEGEVVVVVAVESYQGYLCRTYPQNTTFPDGFPSSNLTSAGVCVLARPEMTQPHNPSHVISFKSNGVTVAAGIDSSSFWVTVDENTLKFNETVKAEAWNMMCVGLSAPNFTPTPTPTPEEEEEEEEDTAPQIYQVWASLHGRPLEVSLEANVTEWEEDVKVCVGAHGDKDASFTGFVTGVTLQAGQEEVTTANCSVLLETNELTMPLNDSWTTYGPVFALEEDLRDPCDAPVRTVVLRETWDYDNFLRLCRSLGGYFPTEEEAATGRVETLNCTSGEYLSWANEDGMREEGPAARCPVLLVGGGVGRRPCLSELECSLCQVPTGLRYTLFGPRTDFDRYYTLRILPEGMFDFQGETSSFQREASGWTLQSMLHRKKLHLNSTRVMGRHTWPSRSPGHATDTLTFTVCNVIQFSSNDGVCLLRSQRCDGRTDSPDMSDEKDCGSQRLIGKDAHYDTGVRPSLVKDKTMTLYYKFDVMVVHKMSTEKGTANVEYNLHLKWEDERLKFIDTKIGRNVFPCEEIWTPTFLIFAGYWTGPAVRPSYNRTMCYLYWEEMPDEEQQLDDPLMGRYIPRARISQYLNFVASYPCLLRVSRYPFGRYVCNLTFSLFGVYENLDWKVIEAEQEKEDPPTIPYSGDHDLLDYRLEKITVDVHWDVITITLHLLGQPDYHLTNSFLPSSLMFVICYSSLFFPIAGFNERIMVSLTSLLVLVALFSQATDSYVRTPYYKLIDVWYVSLILLCFAVVIANGIVNYLRVQRVKSHTGLMKKVLIAKRFNIGSQAVIMLSFGILMFIFALFSNNTL